MAGTCIIVAHDPWDMQLLSMYAERLGMRLLQAFDGPDAVALARQGRPDVIFVDAELPGSLDCTGIVEALREDPVTCKIPVILTISLSRNPPAAPIHGAIYYLGMPPTYPEFFAAMVEAGICKPDPHGKSWRTR